MKPSNTMQAKIKAIAKKFRVDLDVVGSFIRLEHKSGAYMPLSIEVVGKRTIAVHHTYTQNGDLLFDPEIVFWKANDDRWYAIESTGMFGGYGYERVVYDIDIDAGTWGRWKPRSQRDLATFANSWSTNLARQKFTTLSTATVIDPRESNERITRKAKRVVKSRAKKTKPLS